MDNYSDVPIPPETPYIISESNELIVNTLTVNENSMEEDSDSLWQQQLVNAEQEVNIHSTIIFI